jgi:hypothetical protein
MWKPESKKAAWRAGRLFSGSAVVAINGMRPLYTSLYHVTLARGADETHCFKRLS